MRATSRSRTTDPAAGFARTTMSPNWAGSLSRPSALTCISKGVPGGRRRLADLAGGDLDVLLGDRVLHVDRGDAEIGELVGIEPDAHRIAPLAEDLHVADAGQALQRIDDLQIGVVAERDRIDRAVRRGQIDDQDEIRVLLLDRHAALIDDRRQRGRGLRRRGSARRPRRCSADSRHRR